MPKGTDAAKVEAARATVKAAQQSPQWNANPSLQAVMTAWNATADALDANSKALGDARKQLLALSANQRQLRRDWSIGLKHSLASVGAVSKGSADLVHALGFDVLTRAGSGLAKPAPTGLTAALGKAAGEAVVGWERGGAKHGFIVQRATDIANEATFSVPTPCTRTKTTLKGLVSGSSVHVRVAAIDPASESGHSPWSEWISATAR
jgi:hypothetical protein